MTLNDLKREYTHYLEKYDPNGFVKVFSIDTCEVCGCEVLAPNGVGTNVSPAELEYLGLKGRDAFPDEGGYSELHGCATCSACCYDSDARSKAVAP